MILYMTRVRVCVSVHGYVYDSCVSVTVCMTDSVRLSVGDYMIRVCVCEVGLAQLTFNPQNE